MKLLVAVIAILPFLCVYGQSENSDKEVETKKEKPIKAEVVTSDSSSTRLQFTLGVSLNMSADAEADVVITDNSSGDTVRGKVEFELENTLSLDIGTKYSPQNSWGFSAGIMVDGKREVESGKYIIGSTTLNVASSGDPDEVTVGLIYVNAIYKWENFYIPFGLNFSTVSYDSTGLVIDAKGGLGAQLGVGYQFTDLFALEILSRAVAFELKYTDYTEDVTAKFEEGFLTSALVSGRFSF